MNYTAVRFLKQVYKMPSTNIEQIFNIYLHKKNYNPHISNVNRTLREIIMNCSFELVQDDIEFDWDDLNWILKKIKLWFDKSLHEYSIKNTLYNSFIHYLNSVIHVFWKYKQQKAINNNSQVKDILQLKWNRDGNLSKDERLVLCLDISLCDVHNIVLYNNGYNALSIAVKDQIKLWNHPPLSVRQLVNWPYIGFTLNLPDITIEHQADHIFSRYVCLQNCDEILKYSKKCNISNTNRHIPQNKYCNVELLTMYLSLCRQAIFKNNSINERHKKELSILFETIIMNIAFCNDKLFPCNVDNSYPSTKYKFTRENACSCEIDDAKNESHKIIEIIEPSFKINVTRCMFDEKTIQNTVFYLCDEKDIRHQEFINQVNKDISYCCFYCNMKFSESSFYAVESHIHDVHGCDDIPWKCMGCKESFSTYDLATYNWRHKCK